MDELDDFGELYTDLEVDVNADVGFGSSFDHIGDRKNRENHVNEKLYQNNVDIGCSDDESLSSDQSGSNNSGAEDDGKVSSWEKAVSETGGEVCEEDNGSDSEDDLHIVLNEEDCPVPSFPQAACTGDGREPGISDDEDDGLIIGAENGRPAKGPKRGEPSHFVQGTEYSRGLGREISASSKGGYVSQCSQYKYVRLGGSTFRCTTRSMDANGAHQQVISSTGASISSSNSDVLAASQNGIEFCLPRHRSILDVGIETFEWKPWRQHGVDITDFFNFGFNEDSWKFYCQRLENLRRQATMLSRIPVYESSRVDQVNEAEIVKNFVSSKNVTSVQSFESKHEPSSQQSIRSNKRFEKLKGKAIQVEDSTCSRRPSVAIRRPRHRDSDVVIQVPMKETMEDSSISDQDESEDIDDNSWKTSENAGSEMAKEQDSQPLGGGIEDCQKSRHTELEVTHKPLSLEVGRPVCQVVKVQVSGEGDETESAILETKDNINRSCTGRADSPSGDQIYCSLSPSYLESDQSIGSGSDSDNMEPEISRYKSVVPHQEEQKSSSRRKLHEVAETNRQLNDAKSSPGTHKRSRYAHDSLQPLSQKVVLKKESNLSYFHDKDSFDLIELEKMLPYCRERQDKKWPTRTFHTGHIRRNRETKEHPLEQGYDLENDGIRQKGCYFHENEHKNRRKYRKSILSTSDEFHLERERYDWHQRRNEHKESYFHESRRMNEEKHRESILPRSDDVYPEDERYYWYQRRSAMDWHERYRESDGYIQEKYERHNKFHCKGELQDRYRRHLFCSVRGSKTLARRDRYDPGPYAGLDRDWKYPGHYRSPSPVSSRGFQPSDRRGWYEYSPPSRGGHVSLKFKRRHIDHFESRNLHFVCARRNGHEDCHWYKEECHSSLPKELDYDRDQIVYSGRSAERRFGQESQSMDWANNPELDSHGDAESYESELYSARNSKYGYDSENHDTILKHHFEKHGENLLLKAYANHDYFCKRVVASRSGATVHKHLVDWDDKHQSGRSCKPDDTRCHGYDEQDLSTYEYNALFRPRDDASRREGFLQHRRKIQNRRYYSTVLEDEKHNLWDLDQPNAHTNNVWHDKRPTSQSKDASPLEEGQLAESASDELLLEKGEQVAEQTVRSAVVVVGQGALEAGGRCKFEDKKDPNNRGGGNCDDNRIRETLAKMEKRRERFKEPIAVKKEAVVSLKPEVATGVETAEDTQQRPVRKRRWTSG